MLAFAIVAMAASAQTGRLYTTANDTITNTGVATSDVITLAGSYKSLAVMVKYTQLSGTTGGTAVFQGSIDGTNYTTLTDAGGSVKMYPSSTLTIASAAVFHFVVQDVPFKYFKVVSTGSGTSSTKVEVKYLYK